MNTALLFTLISISFSATAKNTEKAIINDLLKKEAEIRRYKSDNVVKTKKLDESQKSLNDVIGQLSHALSDNRKLQQELVELQTINNVMYDTLEKLGGLTPKMVRLHKLPSTRMPASAPKK